MLPVEVACKLGQPFFVVRRAPPYFQFDDVFVLEISDDHIEAFFVGNLRFFKSIAVAVDDGLEETEEQQAAVPFQKLAVFFTFLFYHEPLEPVQHFLHVEPVAGQPVVGLGIVAVYVRLHFYFAGHVVENQFGIDAVVDLGAVALFVMENPVQHPMLIVGFWMLKS